MGLVLLIVLLLVFGVPLTILIVFLIWRATRKGATGDQVIDTPPPPPGAGLDG